MSSLHQNGVFGLFRRAALCAALACGAPALADWGTDFSSATNFTFQKGGKAGTGGGTTTNFSNAIFDNSQTQYMRLTSPGVTAGQTNLVTMVVPGHTIKDVRVRALINASSGDLLNGLQGVVARYNTSTGACYALMVDFTNKTIQLQEWTAGSSVPTVLRTSTVNDLIRSDTQYNAELIVNGNAITGNLWNATNTNILVSETTQRINPLPAGLAGFGIASRIVGGAGTSVPAGDFDNVSAIASIKDADLNRDGFDDIFWRNQSVGNNGVWLLNSSGTIGGWSGIAFVGDLNWRMISTGDFDHDNTPDVLWHNTTTGDVAVWTLNTDGTMKQFTVVGNVPLAWKPQGCADFNRDGNVDVVFRNTSTGENGMWLLDRTTLKSFIGVPFVGDLGWNIEATGDFNRDGSPDLVWRNSSTGGIAFWLMNGTRLLEFQLFTTLGTEWQIIGSGDMNNDSLVDIVWRNNNNNLVAHWFMISTQYLGWQPVEFIPSVVWRGVN